MNKKYDIIIIWAWAAGLFTAIQAPKQYSKLILEKWKNPWVKVLLSGWERANVSNIDIEPQRDYFGQNKKALISLFKQYNNYDIISFFAENNIKIVEEDRGRLILESWDSRELLNLLVKKTKENNTKIECDSGVIDIKKIWEKFEIFTSNNEKFTAWKVVITSWWKSFSQVWTTGDGYTWAENFWHTIIHPHRGLCWLVTKKDMSEISGVSANLKWEVCSKLSWKSFYTEYGPLLFTHFWVSGPIIFNAAVSIGEYINSLDLSDFINTLDFSKIPENEKEDYIDRSFIKENIYLKLSFENIDILPKRIVKFFDITENNNEVVLELQDYRTWKEAKVTGWGIKIDELTNHLESKKMEWLYFAWEVLDITGKTGGFNLQLSWTSWYVVGKNL